MKRDISINPEQLKTIVDHIMDSFKADYENGKTGEPHFEHVDSAGYRFKIGYIPNNEGGKVLMEIKIVYKGRV